MPAPHVQRAIDELIQLRERVAKIDAFEADPPFAEMNEIDRCMLKLQRAYMHGYANVLNARVTKMTNGE